MWGSAPFLEQLRVEVWDRYYRLRAQYGEDRVTRPNVALMGALAEITAPIRSRNDERSIRDAATHAGETYEYLVHRLQDPRWREVMTVAVAVGPQALKVGAPRPSQGGDPGATKPRRSAGQFARELLLTPMTGR